MPYPGGNLFSLASGGALYVRDPLEELSLEQLNGGAFAAVGAEDWALVEPCLEENERLFGIPLEFLLTVDGRREPPEYVYRKIQPVEHVALTPEEAWVKRKARGHGHRPATTGAKGVGARRSSSDAATA
jgi:hypothetical protein